MLVHELGHHATRASRVGLATGWLALPGRLAFRLVLALAVLAGGARRLGPAIALVAAAGGAVAIVQAVQRGQWLSAGILSAVAASLVLTPLLDALISRASEHAGRSVAPRRSAPGPISPGRLTVLGGSGSRRTLGARLVDRHPAVADQGRAAVGRRNAAPSRDPGRGPAGPPFRSVSFRPGAGRRRGGPREGDALPTGTAVAGQRAAAPEHRTRLSTAPVSFGTGDVWLPRSRARSRPGT